MPYGIVLLPSGADSVRLVGYAAAFGSGAVMALGPQAPPHITLAHVDCAREAADAWWAASSALLDAAYDVTLCGLMLAPVPVGNLYVPEGGIYAGLEAVRRSALEAAHRLVLGTAVAAGAPTIGAVGGDYRPHVTLGVLGGVPVTVPSLPEDLLTATLPTRLAYGRIGPYGTVPEIIERR